ncbi:hypothetical protein LCGC14_3071060 [marine sediment metagenome]|uniref:Uncharacterized protein n=1 Tax=marine sediment metagenome TaxID=412755 RepID=A0A0F8Z6N6_9ZZZZ
MGDYINPPEGTKEDWLEENGELVAAPSWPPPADMVLVCLVDNGPFTAAAICYDEGEFSEFNAPDPTYEEVAELKARAEARGIKVVTAGCGEQRPRTWYVVSRKNIVEVCPDVAEMLP